MAANDLDDIRARARMRREQAAQAAQQVAPPAAAAPPQVAPQAVAPPAAAAPPVPDEHLSARQRMHRTIEGNAPPRTPEPRKTLAQVGKQWDDYGGGAATSAIAGLPGLPGDLNELVGDPLGRVGMSPPTTTEIGDRVMGPPENEDEARGRRHGAFLTPVPGKIASKVAQYTALPLLRTAVGAMTGGGPRAIREAYMSGKVPQGKHFREQVLGKAPVADAVATARQGVENLRKERAGEYRAGIGATIAGDPRRLNFAPIENAVLGVMDVGMYEGKTVVDGAEKVWKKIADVVDEWGAADPAKFHTPEGLDALKQRIGNLAYAGELKDIAAPGKPGNVIIEAAYGAVKDQIKLLHPEYAKVMADYEQATDTLREMERGLSLGEKATIDTSSRKLQSILRNNAQANYGHRAELGEKLNEKSGGKLMPQLAGQALNSPWPRGIQGALASAGTLGTAGAALAQMDPSVLAALPALALSSPRLMGMAAHTAGRLKKGVVDPVKLPMRAAQAASISEQQRRRPLQFTPPIPYR